MNGMRWTSNEIYIYEEIPFSIFLQRKMCTVGNVLSPGDIFITTSMPDKTANNHRV